MTAQDVKGLWHVALRVTDLQRSQAFYEGFFGMKVVWAPDPDNLYLSSGSDNLALHQLPAANVADYRGLRAQFLDHIGFIMGSVEAVDRLFERVERGGVKIVKGPKRHRDGSYSFYMADPDDNVVQVLYEPNISHR
ncbi:MAG: VOC family protein [Nitrospirae bacterium]|nr:MAG: VOC family protein [Nitrospirota bacterium]